MFSRHEGAFGLQSTMSKVKDNLKELEVRRRELNGNNDLVERPDPNSTTTQFVLPILVILIVCFSNG